MHILHMGSEYGWRGGENQILLLIQGLNQQGVKNSVAYPEGSPALDRFSEQGVPTLALPSNNPLSPKSIQAVKTYCISEQVSIIDAHSAKAHQLALIVKAFVPSLRLVVHRRVDNKPSSSWWTKKRYHSAKVDHYVAISRAIKDILINYGIPSHKVSLVYSAIDSTKYQSIKRTQARQSFLKKLQLKEQTFLIGNASALSPQKGYDTLIRALSHIKADTRWHMLIAGDGELKESLVSQAKELGVSDRIDFLGFINNVPEFLSALDLVCVPSNNEGLGTIILDSIAAGTPVIGSQVGGIPEIIKDQETGLLIPVGDDIALSEAIQTMIYNDELRGALLENAKVHLEKNFSLEAMVQGNLSVYQSLIPAT